MTATVPRDGPCNYCGQPILWATSRNDILMPLDALPASDGNVVVHSTPDGPLAEVIGTAARRIALRRAGVPLHLHHNLSCPRAPEWSGARKTYQSWASRHR